MPDTQTRRPRDLSSYLKAARPDTLSYRQVFEQIDKAVPFAEAMIVSSLPRATLQIVQPMEVPESLLKAYSREFHAEDRASWRAILTQQPVRAEDCWPDAERSARYIRDLLEPHGLRHLAVVPLQSPVLPGYPGALHLYRAPDRRDFSDSELRRLADLVEELGQTIARLRKARLPALCAKRRFWAHDPRVRLYIYDSRLRLRYPSADQIELDRDLQEQLVQEARRQLHELDKEDFISERVLIADALRDKWSFRVTGFKRYPALGSGAFVFFCLQPEYCDWTTIRPADFQADEEISKLIPAAQFMLKEFRRSPRLYEISGIAGLSPFHFHRRFTELLGLTPKHFLLECQMFESKRKLLAREKELVKIAADCGFAHQSHFTSRFKQATGLTPTRWRRTMEQAAREIREG